MKKLLNLLAILIIVPSSTLVVISCTPKNNSNDQSVIEPKQNVDVQTTLDALLSKSNFTNQAAVENSVIEGIEALNGIENIVFTWIESVAKSHEHDFQIAIDYTSGYQGESVLKATVLISEDLTSAINTQLTEISAKIFINKKAAENEIISSVQAINGIAAVSVIWISETTYELNLSFIKGYTVIGKVSGRVRLKDEAGNQIANSIKQWQEQYFDSLVAAEEVIKTGISAIEGVSSVTSFTWINQIAAQPSFRINVSYKETYTGNFSYDGYIKGIRTNLDAQISAAIEKFKKTTYNQFEDSVAKTYLDNLISKIEGIKIINLVIVGSDVTLALAFEDQYLGTIEWHFTITRKPITVGMITTQYLSYRTNQLSRTINLTTTNLGSWKLEPSTTSTKIDVVIDATNKKLSLLAKSNIIGTQDYVVDIIAIKPDNTRAKITSFTVQLEGFPKYLNNVAVPATGFDLRKGLTKSFTFKMDYFDPSQISALTLVDNVAGNKIKSSIVYVKDNLYQITYTPNIDVTFAQPEAHTLSLQYNSYQITSFSFNVYNQATWSADASFTLPNGAGWDQNEINLPKGGKIVYFSVQLGMWSSADKIHTELYYATNVNKKKLIADTKNGQTSIGNENMKIEDIKFVNGQYSFKITSTNTHNDNFWAGYQTVSIVYTNGDQNASYDIVHSFDVDVTK